VVIVGPRGFGLNVVGLLRTDCLGPGICARSEDDESDYSLHHYHQDHHHHLEVWGFPPLSGGSISSSLSMSGGPLSSGGLAYSS